MTMTIISTTRIRRDNKNMSEIWVTMVDLLLLETGAKQVEACRLYERLGYQPRGPFAGYPDNGASLFMEKQL